MTERDIEEGLKNPQWEHFGLPVIKHGERFYAVASSREIARKAAEESIFENVLLVDEALIFDACGLNEYNEDAKASFRKLISRSPDDARVFVEELIRSTCGIDEFLSRAIDEYGRGQFLSPYDGKQIIVGKYLIYRVD